MKLEPKRDTYKAAHQRIQVLAYKEKYAKEIQDLRSQAANEGASVALLRKVEDLLRVEPESVELKILFCRCVSEKKIEDKFSMAHSTLEKLKATRPQDAEVSLTFARFYEATGETKAAIKEAKEALQKNSKLQSAEKLIARLKGK